MVIIVNENGKVVPLAKAEGMIVEIDEMYSDTIKLVETKHGKYKVINGQLEDVEIVKFH